MTFKLFQSFKIILRDWLVCLFLVWKYKRCTNNLHQQPD